MSTKTDSWKRLKKAAWCKNIALAQKNDKTAKFQLIEDGSGSDNFDEYSVTFSRFPKTISPEKYLQKFAMDINGTVNNSTFNLMNKFKKRSLSRLEIGDIWDIDILGPDNGSIVLVDLSAGFGCSTGDSWFDIQTIECDKYGSHPECGAREFGFEYVANDVKFYTRGVSRPRTFLLRSGAGAQERSWNSMIEGIRTSLVQKGAVVKR